MNKVNVTGICPEYKTGLQTGISLFKIADLHSNNASNNVKKCALTSVTYQ